MVSCPLKVTKILTFLTNYEYIVPTKQISDLLLGIAAKISAYIKIRLPFHSTSRWFATVIFCSWGVKCQPNLFIVMFFYVDCVCM